MTEERLRELENLYYGMNDRDATDILTEIRRLQRENARLRPVFEAAVAVRVDADYPWYDGWKNYLPPMLKASLPDLCDAVDAAKAKEEHNE